MKMLINSTSEFDPMTENLNRNKILSVSYTECPVYPVQKKSVAQNGGRLRDSRQDILGSLYKIFLESQIYIKYIEPLFISNQ